MNANEQRAVLNIMIHAALSDGRKSEDERAAIRDAAESLASEGGATLAGVYQDVLLKRVTLESAAAALPQLEHRQLAYEMAVCVCDADGGQSEGERAFLASLRRQLGLEGDEVATAAASQADAITAAAYAPAAYGPAAAYAATAAYTPAPPAPTPNATHDAALDKRILNYSILNGALELLPQSWASMAIIPLQVRMVYRIGQSYGVNLDQGHIKEFLATVGVGLTSQYVEQIGRKLVGGLLGKAAGGMIGGLGRAATGMAFSFATTYALGHLAKRYYAGGRVMSTALLRSTYQDLLSSAKGTQQQYIPAIRERASTLTPTEVMRLVKE
ncbi:MAG: YcjF family protein [Steroidobacteraceae bacterium]